MTLRACLQDYKTTTVGLKTGSGLLISIGPISHVQSPTIIIRRGRYLQ